MSRFDELFDPARLRELWAAHAPDLEAEAAAPAPAGPPPHEALQARLGAALTRQLGGRAPAVDPLLAAVRRLFAEVEGAPAPEARAELLRRLDDLEDLFEVLRLTPGGEA